MTRPARMAGALLALTVLATACVGPFARGPEPLVVSAVLPRSNNLFEGSEVRILGVQVGSVVELRADGPNVVARMEVTRPDTHLPADVYAVVSPTSLLGERFVQLMPPYAGGATLASGGTIPLERTSVPAEVDEVLASFERFVAGLDPERIAVLVDVLSETLEGQGEGLNDLIGEGSETIRVLADASEDLNAVVSALADLNTTVATRDEQLGQTIEDWSTVVRTFGEESQDIVEGVEHLRRLTAALRPLIDDHADPLVTDLEILATTLSTVERNLDRIGQTIFGARKLFEGAGRAFEYENARLKLDNESEYLSEHITLRLRDRLVGVCVRLGIAECAADDFWEGHLPGLVCLPDLIPCDPDKATVAAHIRAALGFLPPEAVEQLVEEAAAPAPPAGSAPPPPPSDPPDGGSTPPPGGSIFDRLPLPDPRLEVEDVQPPGVRERLAAWLGAA